MKVYSTTDPSQRPPINMIVYGDGGVGKTTLATTAPKPLLLDLEGGAKYFGLRGISIDVVTIDSWSEINEVIKMVKEKKYETLVIDPIGELMALIKRYMESLKDTKLTQRDGQPTQAGWGYMKQQMRQFLRQVRDIGAHSLIIAHVDDMQDEGKVIKFPLIETKIGKEMVNMFDMCGYMMVAGAGESAKRVIVVDPESDKYKAKDRSGQLGKIIEPDFTKIVNACQGTETYSWSKPKPPAADLAPDPEPKASKANAIKEKLA